jgi:pimeloyl-ACP methyl ester carboxylesterase
MQISEQAVVLSQSRSLVGIFARPVGRVEPAPDVAVVILNTGIIHRVGHNRMYVTLSRALAGSGYMVIRFDFSGIGDSDKPNDGLSPLESSLSDVREVLDWLQSTKNINRVVLIGLCLGADHAVRYAAIDPRVAGLVLMDPSMPPTLRYFRDYLWDRLLNARSWFNVAFGKSRLRWMLIERIMMGLFKDWQPRYPTLTHPKLRWQLEQIYQASVDRGVKFLVVLTASGSQTYAEQLVEALPNVNFLNLLRSEFFRDCDHIFISEASRARLQNLILEWLRETCSGTLTLNPSGHV